MSHSIVAKFEFRPIGQGLFFTGKFKHVSSRKSFTMVYDCGHSTYSTNASYIDAEIDEFVLEIGDKIDMLVISHFHADHINKITELLTKSRGAKEVYLPYLSEEEKYLYLIDNLFDGNSDKESVRSFINDPISFFKKLDVKHINFIHHNDKPDDSGSLDTEPKPFDDNPEFEFKITKFLDKNTVVQEADKQENVHHHYDSGYIELNHFWQFKFFNKKRDVSLLSNFKTELKSLLKTPNDPTQDDITNALSSSRITIKNLKSVYVKVFGSTKLNDTSMLLFNIPKSPRSEIAICNCPKILNNRQHLRYLCCNNRYRYIKHIHNYSFLLTGDIKLNDSCSDELESKWGQRTLDQIRILQIPHHGANKYLTKVALDRFSGVNYGEINYGLGNQYRHPSKHTIELIYNANTPINLMHATQINSVRIKYILGNLEM
jgi:ribonuclease BN (tRNA processing enzyme)